MGVRGAARGALAAAAIAVCSCVLAPQAGAAAPDRYDISKGCYALTPTGGGGFVAQTGNGYSASATDIADAEPFRMQATELGMYLFYGQAQDFMGIDGSAVSVLTAPGPAADWTVDGPPKAFMITHKSGQGIGLSGDDLVLVPAAQAQAFTFKKTTGCAEFPEISLNATGDPLSKRYPYGEVTGTIDGHMHMMAFEFLGGHAHCGEPWNRYGAPEALKDCEDHEPNGCSAVLETGLGGDACHGTGGWPDFQGWPDEHSLTHESAYYRWLERAHLAGLRIFVNLMVENRVLCEIYPDYSVVQGEPKTNCDEMDTVRRENKRIEELENYIDAQEGGPGEGWFRIVESPFEARREINKGNLAVIKGMEVSEPFDCGYKGVLDNPVPPLNTTPDSRCSEEHISESLDELWDMGIRQMEITNKFDNQLTGVAGDGGQTGLVVNTGQYGTSGSFWDFGPENGEAGSCDEHNHDRIPGVPSPTSQDEIFGNGLDAFLPGLPVVIPVYTANQVCNKKGFQDGDPAQNGNPAETNFGRHALEGIMDRGFVFDPDHMSVIARDEALDIVEDADYPGVISSHSWSTENTLARVYKLGGMVTPYAGSASSFVGAYDELRAPRNRDELGDQYFGVGYGADANGFGSQGEPRMPAEENDVDYPFTGLDGSVTFDQQVSGPEGVGKKYDINTDGVDHYGLYPDWLEDLRQIAGEGIVNDMNRGAEAYLQMWERTYGVPEVDCTGWDSLDLSKKGIGDRLRLNESTRDTLERAGQPVVRVKNWRWCAGDGRESEEAVTGHFSNGEKLNYFISNLDSHKADGVGPGDSESKLKNRAIRVTDSVYLSSKTKKRAYVWVVKDGEVTHAGAVFRRGAEATKKLAGQIKGSASK